MSQCMLFGGKIMWDSKHMMECDISRKSIIILNLRLHGGALSIKKHSGFSSFKDAIKGKNFIISILWDALTRILYDGLTKIFVIVSNTFPPNHKW